MAILSGRSLADIRRRVGLPRVVYGGCHGLELHGPGLRFRYPGAPSIRARLRAVAAALEAARPRFPGARLEPKDVALAVHYRRVPASRVASLRRLVRRLAREAGLGVLAGKRIWDLVPPGRRGKSAAVRLVRDDVRKTSRGTPVTVYAGDDATDAEVFRKLGRRIIGVQVGGRRGPAAYRLRGVRDVHAWLRRIAALAAADRRPNR